MSPRGYDPQSQEPALDEKKEYLLDMIEQLSRFARDIGEIEVAIHLDATAEARRFTLEKRVTS